MESREKLDRYINELFSLVKSGRIEVKIPNVFPLEDFVQAQKVRLFLGHLYQFFITPIYIYTPIALV
jgi:NADPH:quinone reductase-like Zn-dependent oxidoreductase